MKLKKPKSLTEMVVERLKEAIINGEIGLGENISEEKLAGSFGVSRTPVRDALSILQLQGFVTVKSKRGSFVFTPTTEDVVHICEHREILESNAAELSVRKAKHAIINDLQKTVSNMAEAMRVDDPVTYGQLDIRFHQSLFTHCGNPYLVDSYNLTSGRIAALRTHLTRPFEELRELSFAEHQRIVKLLEGEDFVTFRHLLGLHISRTLEIYTKALDENREMERKLSFQVEKENRK